jgi:hypothetical protein
MYFFQRFSAITGNYFRRAAGKAHDIQTGAFIGTYPFA